MAAPMPFFHKDSSDTGMGGVRGWGGGWLNAREGGGWGVCLSWRCHSRLDNWNNWNGSRLAGSGPGQAVIRLYTHTVHRMH